MLDKAYQIGVHLALESLEKEASVMALGKSILGAGKALWASKPVGALKFMAGFGKSPLSQHVAMPTSMGLYGAATAEEGQRMKAFLGGVGSGVAGNIGWTFGGKAAKGLGNTLGKRFGQAPAGQKMWGSLGKINPNYGANRLAKHEAASAKGLADHKELLANAKPGEALKPFVPPKFTGDATHSFGQHVAKDWAPKVIGVGGGIGGAMALDPLGVSLAESAAPVSRRGAFNPVTY